MRTDKTKVVCISGHARSGKDTVAKILHDQLVKDNTEVLITHYADLLKYICKTFFNWNGKKDEQGRTLLQYVGTEVIREKHPDFWVDFIATILKDFGVRWDVVIIPDTRFPNEISRLREYGFDVVHLRIDRLNFSSPLTEEQLKHPSETALDNVKPDYLITNDGGLNNLKDKVMNLITEVLYE